MLFSKININDIIIDGSRFSLRGILYGSDHQWMGFDDSVRNLGMISPVVVYADGSGQLHLVDGRKRIDFLKMDHHEKISAIILQDTTPVTDIVTFILCNKTSEIEISIMNKVRFIHYAMKLEVPGSWILNSLCVEFGFRPYSDFLRDCQRVDNLPEEIKHFCHEKKFSLKQILNLTHYPEEILLQLMAWRPEIQLTASIMEEIASNLKDHLRARNKKLAEFVQESGIAEITKSNLSPRDKTERLREIIRLKRFPILSGVNARMQKTVETLKLPDEVSVDWDRTLENKNVDIILHMRDIGRYDELTNKLRSQEMKKAVQDLLDEL